MRRCAKCGKTLKTFEGQNWWFKDSFPEFYHKPLCDTCYNELRCARFESAEATAQRTRSGLVESLCEHLGRMGLNATVKSKAYPFPIQWDIIGSISIVNRNIDFVEMEWAEKVVGESGWIGEYDDHSGRMLDVYRCNFVVQGNVDGLEDKLRAYTEPVTKGFFSRQVVDFEWKGKELARVLNSDADIRRTLYMLIVKHRGHSEDRPAVEVEPFGKDQCVRISSRFCYSPVSAFPTPEAFEVYDRIAQHIRSIANVHVR